MSDDHPFKRLRESLGAGASLTPPAERLWTRIEPGLPHPGARATRRRRSALLGLTLATAAVVLVALALDSRGGGSEWRSPSAVAATNRSLHAIDSTLDALRRDSTATPRITEEMFFLSKVRAALVAEFATTLPEGSAP